ncbi:MAG: hypothetical protein AAGA53_14760 [Pseudomonadota bacterium]
MTREQAIQLANNTLGKTIAMLRQQQLKQCDRLVRISSNSGNTASTDCIKITLKSGTDASEAAEALKRLLSDRNWVGDQFDQTYRITTENDLIYIAVLNGVDNLPTVFRPYKANRRRVTFRFD